jgi:secreted Zn-dependent insulinase-like peptidase
MRLVVTGAYPLDELQERVIQCFSDIPSNSRSGSDLLSDVSISPVGKRGEYSWDDVYQSPMKDLGMPLAKSCLAKIFCIAPVKDRHSLSVTWQIPSIYDQWRSKPTDYLAHLIGHEAKGSLLASLKEKSWVTDCWAGVGDEGYEVRGYYIAYYNMLCMESVSRALQNWQSYSYPTRLFLYLSIIYRMLRRMLCLLFPLHCPRRVSRIGHW